MTMQTKQVFLYSITTNDLFNEKELEIREKYNTVKYYKDNLSIIEGQLDRHKDNQELHNKYLNKKEELANTYTKIVKEYGNGEVKEVLNAIKKELKAQIKMNTDVRVLNPKALEKTENKIAQFESTFTRALGIKTNETTDKFMVVEVIHYDMMKQIIDNGYKYNDKLYKFTFASAGQIREKRIVCVEEESYKSIEKKLFAGLTDDIINNKEFIKIDKDGNEVIEKGIAIGKLLAYKALCTSASVEWKDVTGKDFNMNDVLILPDFEFKIEDTEYEYINSKYDIIHSDDMTDKQPLVNPVSDGCGYILPSYFNRNVQIRSSWIKGLLTPFDWIAFAKEQKGQGYEIDLNTFTVNDVWGNPQSLKGKKIILTASQVKMWKYYDSFEDFKKKFEENGSEFAVCNIESIKKKDFADSTISYQMLQTLYNTTDDELDEFTSYTRNRINRIIEAASTDKIVKDKKVKKSSKELKEDNNFLLNLAGANVKFKRPIHKALSLTDELLKDKYIQSKIRDVRDSLIEDAQSGSLIMEGSRTMYILPDVVAFGEWLYGLEIKGQLKADEVSCQLFENGISIDMLRSPHLYIEHSINTNKVDKRKYKYYKTMGIYTSIYSTASFELAFDVDGDIAVCVPSETFIEVAKRHMDENKVKPLAYEMEKGKPQIINEDSIYKTLCDSFSANIGVISNQISKVFNKGKDDITEKDIENVKLLKYKNNQEIDFAKTGFRIPIENADIKKRLSEIDGYIVVDDKGNKNQVKIKLPHFFIAVKNKKVDEVEPINNSTVNRIFKQFDKSNFETLRFSGRNKFDYTLLMSDKAVEINEEIITQYEELINKYSKQVQAQIMQGNKGKKNYAKVSKIDDFYNEMIKNENGDTYEPSYVVDVLIKYLYETTKVIDVEGNVKYPSKTKNLFMLWESKFGEVLLHNLEINLIEREKATNCLDCGNVINRGENNNRVRCTCCAEENKKRINAEVKAKSRNRIAV